MVKAITVSRAMPRNTQRQCRYSVTAPARNGPTSEGTTHAAEKAANTRPCVSGGYTRATTTYSATVCPPAPSPCTSRPTTSMGIVAASPAMTSPRTKRATAAYSGPRGPDRSLQAPAATIPITLVASVPAKATA